MAMGRSHGGSVGRFWRFGKPEASRSGAKNWRNGPPTTRPPGSAAGVCSAKTRSAHEQPTTIARGPKPAWPGSGPGTLGLRGSVTGKSPGTRSRVGGSSYGSLSSSRVALHLAMRYTKQATTGGALVSGVRNCWMEDWGSDSAITDSGGCDGKSTYASISPSLGAVAPETGALVPTAEDLADASLVGADHPPVGPRPQRSASRGQLAYHPHHGRETAAVLGARLRRLAGQIPLRCAEDGDGCRWGADLGDTTPQGNSVEPQVNGLSLRAECLPIGWI